MKTLKINFILILSSIFIFSQCTQNESLVVEEKRLNEETLIDLYIKNKGGLDAEDSKINKDILIRSIVLKDLLNENEINSIVQTSLTKKSISVELSSVLDWNDLVDKNEAKIIDILGQYGLKDIDMNYVRNLGTKISYEEVDYDIMFYCYQCTEMKDSKYLSSGLEITKDDDILAWNTNNGQSIILNEGNPLFKESNVLIMDFQNQGSKELSNRPAEQSVKTQNIEKRSITKIFTGNTKDNMRFDWWGNEEFAMTLIGISEDDTNHNYLRPDLDPTGPVLGQRKLHEIHPDDLGTTFWGSYDIVNTTDVGNPPILEMFLYFNLFERDWQYSNKPMGNVQRLLNGAVRYLGGNTKYATHWLMYNPSSSSNNPSLPAVSMNNLDSSWSLEFTNSRSTINFHKDQ